MTSIRHSRPTRAIAHTAAVIAAMLGLAACGSGTGTSDSTSGDSAGSASMEHIHGLGVDPSDGALYAGTHYGLFRVPARGKPTRVGDRVQDFMGFTVVGPHHFLASGHPGEGQGGPASVGLIESTDGGESWKSLSLSGKADFHSLDDVGGTTYGLNSMTGQLLASTDGRKWQVRSSDPIANFAVNPKKPSTLVLTTQQGPAISTDGGATTKPIPDAPLLSVVDWAVDGTLVGASPDGAVYRSTDSGTSWKARGKLAGPPEALDAESADVIYAAANGTIWRSKDGGTTFTAFPGSQ